MTTVAIFNTIVVLFAYLARFKGYGFFLKVSFFLIFLFLALRYNYGNDYPAYLESFLEINRYASIDYSDESLDFEPGWVFLCRLFQPVGFFTLVAVLAAFNCFVYYRFIKKYVSPGYYWFAVFLYSFNINAMLIHSSAMRQSLAISLFIFSIDYLYKKNIIRYLLCIGMASLIHKSALILIPVYFIGAFNWKVNRTLGFILFCLYILLFIGGGLFRQNIAGFINEYLTHYSDYTDITPETTGVLGFLYLSFLALLTIYYAKFQNNENALLFKIVILSFMFIPFTSIIFLIERLQWYFSILTIAVYPIILLNIKNIIYKTIIIMLIIIYTSHGFYLFFQSDIWKAQFSTYHTIFSSPYFFY